MFKIDSIISRLTHRVEAAPAGMVVNVLAPDMPVCVPPPGPAAFGGRDADLNQLRQCFEVKPVSPVIVFYGPTGSGKTTLAAQLTADLYRDGVFNAVLWTNLTINSEPLQILETCVHQVDPDFSLPDVPLCEALPHIKTSLEQMLTRFGLSPVSWRFLIVLDEVTREHTAMMCETIAILQAVLPPDSITLIVTDDAHLAQQPGVRGLAAGSSDQLADDDNVKLLQAYLPDTDPALLRALSNALDGYPLALGLAAKRILNAPDDRPGVLAAHLRQYQDTRLAAHEFSALPFKRAETPTDSLRLALAGSYYELSETAQRQFRDLGLLAPNEPVDLPTLAALWGIEREAAARCAESFSKLSLFEPDRLFNQRYGEGWYRQHPVLHTCARALLHQAGEYPTTLTGFVPRLIKLASVFYGLLPDGCGSFTPYLAHIHAISGALIVQKRNADNQALLTAVQRFARDMNNYFAAHSLLRQRQWANLGYEVSQALRSEAGQVFFLDQLSAICLGLGEAPEALGYDEQLLRLMQTTGDKQGEAVICLKIGLTLADQGDLDRAIAYVARCVDIEAQTGSPDVEHDRAALLDLKRRRESR